MLLAHPARCCVCSCFLSLVYLYLVAATLRRPEATYVYNHPGAFPTVALIGTLKGGTTDLFEQLTNLSVNNDPQRPDPPIKTRYEFNRTWKEKELATLYYPKSFLEDWFPGKERYMHYLYRLRHPCAEAPLDQLSRCVSVAGEQQYTMDATPGYLRSPTAPVRLATISPYTKIIAMLREPIRRVQSLFYHFQTHNDLWQNMTLNDVAQEFLDVTLKLPGMPDTLSRLAECRSVECYAMGWRELCGLGNIQDPHWVLWFGPLYTYGLAGWQHLYLRPGRAMIVDSHEYYRNRTAVMEQVIFFLYGRPMTAVEVDTARGGPIANLGIRRFKLTGSGRTAPWALSLANRKRLRAFYKQHLYSKLRHTLQELRAAGASVLGFTGAPWTEVLGL